MQQEKILTEKFLDKYKAKQPKWGFNGLGYIVYARTYSRIKDNGNNEEWFETVYRCINGAQSIGAQYTKEEAERLYDYIFNLKCCFAGRMLWQLGTDGVAKYHANSLLNCFFVQMNNPDAFCFLFENLMLGGGVGFSVRREDIHELPKVKEGVCVEHLSSNDADFIVPDSREGWVYLLYKVLKAFYRSGKSFTYSTILVRGKGSPIKGFGGVASGPTILIEGIQKIVKIFQSREGKKLRSIDVLDVCNLLGSIVVAGNVRRSAQIALGDPDDYLFVRAKRWELSNVPNHRAMSNNTIYADDFTHISNDIWKGFDGQGEAYGFFNLPLAQKHGRLKDEKIKDKCTGLNPCVTGDTKIIYLKPGKTSTLDETIEISPICDLVGKRIKIWNGQEWSYVVPQVTGMYQKILTIILYDGRQLKCTLYHKWILKNGDIKTASELIADKDEVVSYTDFNGKEIPSSKIRWIVNDGIHNFVYCFSEPLLSQGVFNGILTKQCGEINLESYECCVGYHTPLITKNGITTIGEASDNKQEIEIWNGKKWSKVKPYKTRKNEKLYRVYFNDGSFLDCTSYHKFSVKNRFSKEYKTVETKDLLKEKYKIHTEPFKIKYESGIKYNKDAYTFGFAVGDGHVDKNQAIIVLYGNGIKCPIKGTRSKIKQYARYNQQHQRVNVTNYVDLKKINSLKNDHSSLDELFSWDKNSILQFIAGLADSDGCEASNGIRIYISQEKRALKLQLLLTKCGIKSSVNLCQRKNKKTNLGIRTKDLYYLQITNSFDIPTYRLRKSYKDAKCKGKWQVVKDVVELEGLHNVYCFSETEKHMGVFNNTLTYQCNLGELFLPNISSEEELIDCAKLLYKTQKAVNCMSFLHEQTEKIVHKNMRIGISISGICQAKEKITWLDNCYKSLKEFDKEWSKKNNLSESIKLTTVKPSGTLSLLAGVSPGIHPPFSQYFIRRIRIMSDDRLTKVCKDLGYTVEYALNFDESIDHRTIIVEFPCYADNANITAKDMSAVNQLELLKQIQTEWADNSISCTVYYKKEEIDSIKEWLKNNYERSVKSVSFLLHQEHGFKQAPYEEISKEDYYKAIEKIKTININLSGDELDIKECSGGACPIK